MACSSEIRPVERGTAPAQPALLLGDLFHKLMQVPDHFIEGKCNFPISSLGRRRNDLPNHHAALA